VPELPSGTVTFLFTDVEGSTRLLDELGPEEYARALAEHHRTVRAAVEAQGGVEIDTQGDAFFVAFPTVPGAVAAAQQAQAALAIPVRMGLHTGTPLLTEAGYVGMDVHRAARIAAAGHGGQVLLSASTAALADGIELRDLGEHRLKDLATAERVYQLGDGGFPPLKTLYRTNLPVPATTFVGRSQELRALEEPLRRRDVRLVTLTGPGGAGKTRLALQAAAESADAFPDGLWWVPLAPIQEPALVFVSVLRALDVAEEPTSSPLETTIRALLGKHALLLLDNAEHLLPEIADDILAFAAGCPTATILVTSRERLRLDGEHVYHVPPLESGEAVDLFTARVRQGDPGFVASPAVPELCRRLDRLPLALELAAARAALFSPDQLLARIAERLDLLRGTRSADSRQQTLRATIEWSHDLLGDAERALFGRLSVFAGGCTYEAAEAVCGADLDTFESLIHKSLVRRRETAAGSRYWMLETIRQFAAERLDDSGEADEMRRRHGDWILELAERRLEGRSDDEDEATASLVDERDNIRAALEAASRAGDARRLLALVAAMWRLWDERGELVEGERWATRALELDEGDAPELRLTVLHAAGAFRFGRGDLPRAREALVEELRLAESRRDEQARAAALGLLGRLAGLLGDHEDAVRLLRESVELRRRHGSERLAGGLNQLGAALVEAGQAAEGVAALEQALELVRASGNTYGTAMVMQSLGWALFLAGDPAAAVVTSVDAAAQLQRIGDPLGLAIGLVNSAYPLSELGSREDALVLWAAGRMHLARAGGSLQPLDLEYGRRVEQAARAEVGDAAYHEVVTRAEGLAVEEAFALAERAAQSVAAAP
jgi:predicted ATPase